jgi:GT2 family glycosyltransferase
MLTVDARRFMARLTARARRTAFDLLFATPAPPPSRTPVALDVGAVHVIIRSRNRPLYLWACLDSLYRGTQTACRFVFLDNGSTDAQVRSIVSGFERRGMFAAVHFMERNHAANQRMIVEQYRPAMGRYCVLVDADIVVEHTDPDWLQRMVAIMERDPRLGALGSMVDASDFIDPERARQVAPELPDDLIDQLIKARSPERRLPVSTAEHMDPIPPAGRLLMLRTELFDSVGLPTGNLALCEAVRAAGYRTGIANGVRHRHLSLLNLFDYPDYDVKQLRRYLAER